MGNSETETEILNEYHPASFTDMFKKDPLTYNQINAFYQAIEVDKNIKEIKVNHDICRKNKNCQDVNKSLKAIYRKTSIDEKNTFIEKLRGAKLSPLKTFFILKGILLHHRRSFSSLDAVAIFKNEVINKVIVAILEGELGLTQVSLSKETKQQWETNLVETLLLTYISDDFITTSQSPDRHAKPSDCIFFKNENQEKEEIFKKSGLLQSTFEQHFETLKDLEKRIYNTLIEADEVNFESIPHWESINSQLKEKIKTRAASWSQQPDTWKKQQKKVISIIKNILSVPSYQDSSYFFENFTTAFENFTAAYKQQNKPYSFYNFSLHDEICHTRIPGTLEMIKDALKKNLPTAKALPLKDPKGEKNLELLQKALFLMNDKDIRNIQDPEKDELIRSLFFSLFNLNQEVIDELIIPLTPFITKDMLEALEKKIHIETVYNKQELADDKLPINSDTLIFFIKRLEEKGIKPLPDEEVKKEMDNFFKNDDNRDYGILYRYILKYIFLDNPMSLLKDEASKYGYTDLNIFLDDFLGKLYTLITNKPSENSKKLRDWWKYVLNISLKNIFLNNLQTKKDYINSSINTDRLSYFYKAIEEPELLLDIIDGFQLTDEELKEIYEKNHYNHLKNILYNFSKEQEKGVSKKIQCLNLLQKEHGVNFSKLNSERKTILGSLMTEERPYEEYQNFLNMILKLDNASKFFQDREIVVDYLNKKIEDCKYEKKRHKNRRSRFSPSSSDDEDYYSELLKLYNETYEKVKSKHMKK